MPVDADRLVGLIRDGLPSGETIGVALSGGGDSTALLHLCLAAGLRVEAVTVDHRLRPESAAEAAAKVRVAVALRAATTATSGASSTVEVLSLIHISEPTRPY